MRPAGPGGKWRPSLGLVVLAMLGIVAALPLVGLSLVRLYENQLVRQAESELAGQAAAVAAFIALEVGSLPGRERFLGVAAPGPDLPPYEAALDLSEAPVLPRRPDSVPAPPPAPEMAALGARVGPVLARIRATSLAGFRVTDRDGVVLAGGDEPGRSLAGVEEVASALSGRYRSVMRVRVSKHPQPPLYSLSRGTGIRVYVAAPVLVDGRVAGAVYASRTANNVLRLLYAERAKVAVALGAVAAAVLAIALVFTRLVGRPIRMLVARAAAIGRGEELDPAPRAHYGTREVALLAESQDAMARRLRERSDYVATFAAHVSHELKTPLTAIQGAAELLRDDADETDGTMSLAERRRFLDNMVSDAVRLGALLGRLRELARVENAVVGGRVSLGDVAARLRRAVPGLAVDVAGGEADLALSPENAAIVFGHLADNAARHGASRLALSAARDAGTVRVTVADDGPGIPERDRGRVFEPFYTTRREDGGTGMGLGIVRSLLRTQGGTIGLLPSEVGTAFLVTLPAP